MEPRDLEPEDGHSEDGHPTDDHDADMVDALRRASAPSLPVGAAERIADGAWELASRPESRTGTGRVLSMRRGAIAAAAALVIAAVALSLRGTDALLAVDGDPVQVWNEEDGDWESAVEANAGEWIHVPAGEREITGPDDAVLKPEPGAVFRLVTGVSDGFRIEVRRGSAGVVGGSLMVAMSDLLVMPETTGTQARFHVTFGSGLMRPGRTSPVQIAASVDGAPRVTVEAGEVMVSRRNSPGRLRLTSLEGATVLGMDAEFQLAKIINWSEQSSNLLASMLRGARPVDATPDPGGGMSIVFRGQGFPLTSVKIGRDHLPVAIGQINVIVNSTISFGSAPTSLQAIAVRHQTVDVDTLDRREYGVEKDGVRAVVTIGGGVVKLEMGGETQVFPSLEALRLAAPAVVEMFGEYFPTE